MKRRTLTRIPVEPGPRGVAAVAAAVRALLQDDGPPFAPLASRSAGTSARYAAALSAATEADAPLKSDDIAAVIATSGSTGEPLAVRITTSALTASAQLGATALGPPGHWLTAVPVTGIGGLLTVVRAIQAGAEPLAWPGVGGAETFTAESFAIAGEETLRRGASDGVATYVSLVPTQVARIMRSRAAAAVLSGFNAVLVGGSSLAPRLRAAAESAQVAVIETYGSTETCGGVIYDGKPLPGVLVSVAEDDPQAPVGMGMISVGGPTIAAGYRLRPDLDRIRFVDGWFVSSDLGSLHDGVLTVHGRSDQMINVGGVKVSLAAITEALRSHPRVIDAATISRPDPEWGQAPHAFVVPDEMPRKSDDADRAELRASLASVVAERLGRAATPHTIEFVSEIPAAAGGKPITAADAD